LHKIYFLYLKQTFENVLTMIFNFFKWTSLFLGLHFFILKYLPLGLNTEVFIYNMHSVNLLFMISSFLIITVLYLLAKKQNQYIGFVYLFFLTIKTIICYIALDDVLGTTIENHRLEKFSILILFFFFMIIELTQTSKILNNITYNSKS
jgi:hypothetical protein